MILADMGAEVIRVESIQRFPSGTRGLMMRPPQALLRPETDWGRRLADMEATERPWDRDASFNRHARNKLSCCINLKDPKGKEVFKRLVKVSDVFIENNAAAVTEKLGLTYPVLSEWNPRIIYINNPAWGMTGPYKDYIGFGANVEATTGHAWIRGYPDSSHPMHNTVVYHMDASSGGCGALAVLLALYYRNRTGNGQYIDMAGAETAMAHFPENILEYTMNNRVQRTVGNRDIHGAAPCGCYRCRGGDDEWVSISVTSDEEWQGFCRAIGNPHWAREERFADADGRWKSHDELDQRIGEWTIKHEKYEVMHALQREGVPAGPVINPKDAVSEPQLNARGFFEVLNHRETGVHLYPGVLWKYSKTPMSLRTPPCCLGEHNEYVFKEVIGMSGEEIAELEEKQVIGGDAYIED